MKDFRERSKDRFQAQVSKMLKDLMVSCLDRAEKILRPGTNTPKWEQFRFDILNLGNDKIRLLSDTLRDYNIEFRPIMFSVEYNVDIPVEKLVEFAFEVDDMLTPHIFVDCRSEEVANTFKSSLGCGAVMQQAGVYRFWATGMYDIFNKVIPFFDNTNCLKGKTLEKYTSWKETVYTLEKGNA